MFRQFSENEYLLVYLKVFSKRERLTNKKEEKYLRGKVMWVVLRHVKACLNHTLREMLTNCIIRCCARRHDSFNVPTLTLFFKRGNVCSINSTIFTCKGNHSLKGWLQKLNQLNAFQEIQKDLKCLVIDLENWRVPYKDVCAVCPAVINRL